MESVSDSAADAMRDVRRTIILGQVSLSRDMLRDPTHQAGIHSLEAQASQRDAAVRLGARRAVSSEAFP